MQNPLVSILCVTFNQEKYIRQALDSFLMQETSFPFEIIIHDDASTDNTRAIVEGYALEHPKVIKPLFEKHNQYSLGNFSFVKKMLVQARGVYIAECEGDDFWTDPQKLQKQVDFMESHLAHALCFHPVRVFFEASDKPDTIFPKEINPAKFTISNLLRNNFIQSNSVMYRKQNYKKLVTNVTPLDWYTHVYHAQFGKIGFLPDVMSAYRRHEAGIWWDTYNDREKFWRTYGLAHLRLFKEMGKLFENKPQYQQIVIENSNNVLNALLAIKDAKNVPEIEEIIASDPDYIKNYLISQHKELNRLQSRLQAVSADRDYREKMVMEREAELAVAKEEMNACRTELDMLKKSKAYQAFRGAAKVVKKFPHR